MLEKVEVDKVDGIDTIDKTLDVKVEISFDFGVLMDASSI